MIYRKVIFQVLCEKDGMKSKYLCLMNFNFLDYTSYLFFNQKNDSLFLKKYIHHILLNQHIFDQTSKITLHILFKGDQDIQIEDPVEYDVVICEKDNYIDFEGKRKEYYKKKEDHFCFEQDYDETDLEYLIQDKHYIEDLYDEYLKKNNISDEEAEELNEREIKENLEKEYDEEWKRRFTEDFRNEKKKEIEIKIKQIEKFCYQHRDHRDLKKYMKCRYLTQHCRLFRYEDMYCDKIMKNIYVSDIIEKDNFESRHLKKDIREIYITFSTVKDHFESFQVYVQQTYYEDGDGYYLDTEDFSILSTNGDIDKETATLLFEYIRQKYCMSLLFS